MTEDELSLGFLRGEPSGQRRRRQFRRPLNIRRDRHQARREGQPADRALAKLLANGRRGKENGLRQQQIERDNHSAAPIEIGPFMHDDDGLRAAQLAIASDKAGIRRARFQATIGRLTTRAVTSAVAAHNSAPRADFPQEREAVHRRRSRGRISEDCVRTFRRRRAWSKGKAETALFHSRALASRSSRSVPVPVPGRDSSCLRFLFLKEWRQGQRGQYSDSWRPNKTRCPEVERT